MAKVKYPQEVSAQMQRFKDTKGNFYLDKSNRCFMIRNKTKIHFGKSCKLIGTVFMTNPGSYGLNKINGWNEFEKGEGTSNILIGNGSPDLTLQNIICVIEEGYKKAGKKAPDGYVDIYNISSVVCPKGEDVITYHNKMQHIININNLDNKILVNSIVTIEDEFNTTCQNSPFIILGFVKGVFNNNVANIINWSAKFKNKLVYSLDGSSWYSHPRRWRTEVYLKEKAIQMLSDIV